MSYHNPHYRDSNGRVCTCGCEIYMFWEEFSINPEGFNGRLSISKKCRNKMYKDKCGRDRAGQMAIAEEDKALPPDGREIAHDYYKSLT